MVNIDRYNHINKNSLGSSTTLRVYKHSETKKFENCWFSLLCIASLDSYNDCKLTSL